MKSSPADKPRGQRARYAAKEIYKPRGIPEIEDRKTRFAKISAYVRANGGFVTSIPGSAEVVIEVLPDSPIPDYLISRGYDVRPADPPETMRILASAIVETFMKNPDGTLSILVEGSTQSVAEVRRHAGITRVMRFTFSIA
jgi:hypothetical protein